MNSIFQYNVCQLEKWHILPKVFTKLNLQQKGDDAALHSPYIYIWCTVCVSVFGQCYGLLIFCPLSEDCTSSLGWSACVSSLGLCLLTVVFAVQWGYCNNCGPPLWHASLLVRVWQVLASTVNVLLVRISTHPSSVVGLVFSLHRYTAQIDWSHFSMMGWWVQFQEVVYQKLSIQSPTCFGLSLFYLVLQPAELHAHCF